MSDDRSFSVRILEAFPMRLGSETLLDLTLTPEEPDGFPDPRPGDRLRYADGEVEIWAAPRIVHPEGERRVNVQLRFADLSGRHPAGGENAELLVIARRQESGRE